jgi:hypothetical protein
VNLSPARRLGRAVPSGRSTREDVDREARLTTLDQFISVAVVEKVAALKTADYFVERARRVDFDAFDRIMTGRVASRRERRTQTGAARYRRDIG